MRYYKTLVIQKAAISVIESGMELILCKKEIELTEDVYEYIESHCKKVLSNESSERGRFMEKSDLVDPFMAAIKDEVKFMDLYNKCSEKLHEIIQGHNKAGDFIFVEILVDMEKAYAMLFMEYENAMIHTIEYEDEFKVDLKTQTTMLPQKGKKIKRAAIVFADGEIQMEEKDEKDENKELIKFWISDFLEARKSMKDEEHTRILYAAMEGWLRRNIKEDIKTAIEKREKLRNWYKDETELVPGEVVEDIIDDQTEAEKMILAMQGVGLMTDRPFVVDKTWVGKKMENKKIQFNNGMTISGQSDQFDDDTRYTTKLEEDGTATITIKGVRNLMYK